MLFFLCGKPDEIKSGDGNGPVVFFAGQQIPDGSGLLFQHIVRFAEVEAADEQLPLMGSYDTQHLIGAGIEGPQISLGGEGPVGFPDGFQRTQGPEQLCLGGSGIVQFLRYRES